MENHDSPFVLMLTFEITFGFILLLSRYILQSSLQRSFGKWILGERLHRPSPSSTSFYWDPLLFNILLRSAPLQHHFTEIRSSSTSSSQIYCSSTSFSQIHSSSASFPDLLLIVSSSSPSISINNSFSRSTLSVFIPAVAPDNTVFHFDSFGSCLHFLLNVSSILRPTEHTDHGQRFLTILMWL